MGNPWAILKVGSLQMIDAGLGISLQDEESSFGGQAMLEQRINSRAKSLRLSQNLLPIVELVKGSQLLFMVKVIDSSTEHSKLRNEKRLEGSMARRFPVANPDFGFGA